MRTLTVELQERSYPIYIGERLLDEQALFHRHVDSRQVMIVTNDRVAPLYLDRVKAHFEGRDVAVVVLPDGEKYKTLESADAVYEELLARRFSRTAHLIALGGVSLVIWVGLLLPPISEESPLSRFLPPCCPKLIPLWVERRR